MVLAAMDPATHVVGFTRGRAAIRAPRGRKAKRVVASGYASRATELRPSRGTRRDATVREVS